MFYQSQDKKPYYYKAKRVHKGTSAKGDAYTFVGITHKDKKDDQYKNATLVVWQDLDIKEGDYIAFYDITGVNYTVRETTTNTYIDLSIAVEKVKVKSADEEPAKKTAKKTEAKAQSAPVQEPTARTFEEPLFGGEDDEGLPF